MQALALDYLKGEKSMETMMQKFEAMKQGEFRQEVRKEIPEYFILGLELREGTGQESMEIIEAFQKFKVVKQLI